MRLPTFLTRIALAAIVCGLIAGCESLDFETKESTAERNQDNPDELGQLGPLDKKRPGLGGGSGFLLSGGDKESQGAQLPVNKYLWRGTLDTLSFLPLSSTDPYGGVIVTDWGAAPDSPSERFKVTAYITSAALKPQSLNIVVNRQRRSRDGGWVAAPVADDTKRSLEDAILTRARQLRSAAGDSG